MGCAIRGYEEEVETEQLARNLVYLDQPEIVLGEPLNNITPNLLAVLSAIRSPFYVAGPFDYAHVGQFLWAMHSQYSPRDKKAPRAILKRLQGIPLEQCQSEIEAFMELTFMDMPHGATEDKPIASTVAWLVYRFRHDPWRMTEQETLHTPLRKLYQELRCWERENEKIVANKSDQRKASWLADVNEWLAEDPVNNQRILDDWNAQTRMLRDGEISREQFDLWRAKTFGRN